MNNHGGLFFQRMLREMVKFDESPDTGRTIALLESRQIAWLASIHPDGRPHVVPVWFFWDGEAVWLLAKPGSQKVRNLRGEPRCSLALDDSSQGSEPVVFDGEATLPAGPMSPDLVQGYLSKYDVAIRSMDWHVDEMLADYSQVIRIVPSRFLEIE